MLRLKEKVLGRQHPNTLYTMNKLAEVLEQQGKYMAAEDYRKKSLAIRETQDIFL